MSESQQSSENDDSSKYLGADMPVGLDAPETARDRAVPEPLTPREQIEMILEGVFTQGLTEGAHDVLRQQHQKRLKQEVTTVKPEDLWDASSVKPAAIDGILELVLHLAEVDDTDD